MFLKCLMMHLFFTGAWANVSNSFILDYFDYENISSVVGYSCNTLEGDLILLRNFNKKSIAVAINRISTSPKVNITANTEYWKLGIFLDISCYNTSDISLIFSDASENYMFNQLHFWLILTSNLDIALRMVDDREFGFSTNFVIAVKTGADDYHLYDVYNICKKRGSLLNVTFLGLWNNKENGMDIVLRQPPLIRRSNLYGIPIRAPFWRSIYKPAETDLVDYLQDYSYGTRDAQAKFSYSIGMQLSNFLNYTYIPYEVEKWEPGDPLGPITRHMMLSKADITGNGLVMNVRRTYLLRYVYQEWPFRTCFIFRNPQPSKIKIHEILKPFHYNTWLLMAFFFMIFVGAMREVMNFQESHKRLENLSNSFLITFGAICQQGTEMPIDCTSARITFFFIMIFSLLTYNYYSASVVSVRLADPIFKINDSLTELGKLPVKMASESMPYLELFLKYPDWETRTFYQSYWLKLPVKDRFMLPDLGMHLVQKGGFAYHTHPHIGYPIIDKFYSNREICELMEVHVARPLLSTFAVPTNSSITELIRIGLTKISEVGLRKREMIKWQFRKPLCRKDILSASSIDIHEFAVHLLLLIMGMLLAISTFVLELIIAYKKCYCSFNQISIYEY